MNKIFDIYNEYKGCEKDTWAKRLTWMGRDGKHPKHTTSILRFNEETGLLSMFDGIYDVDALFKRTSEIATEYTSWVASKNRYEKYEFDDMHNFFIGAIGELFFYYLFVYVKRIISVTGNTLGLDGIYDFVYVSPTLNSDKDSGVDFTAYINDKPSVIQVKFWNQFSGERIKLSTIQKAYAEGVSKDFIDKSDKENVFICCLGSEKSVYDIAKTYRQYKDNLVVIGRESLDVSINGRNKLFWKQFSNSLSLIK